MTLSTTAPRVVIYTRVSSDPKGTRSSVEEQELLCRRIVEANGWHLITVYCDNNKSASKTSVRREKWEDLTASLIRREFDILVVWEPSRATRDRWVWAKLAADCEENKVRICANGRLYDPDDPGDAFQLDIFFALARLEAKTTGKRVMRTTKIRAEKGRPGPGKTPYGYKRVYSESNGETVGLVPDDESRTFTHPSGAKVTYTAADTVRFIFSEIRRGITPYTISVGLNKRGIPNPRTAHTSLVNPGRKREYGAAWNPVVIRHIIQNPAYLGLRKHMGLIVTETPQWDRLVDAETFYMIASQFADRKLDSPRPARAKYFLSRLACCFVCERKVQATTHPKQATGYRCLEGHCFSPVRETDLFVETWVRMYLSVEENIERLAASVVNAEAHADDRVELERLQADLKKWKKAATSGQIDLEMYLTKQAEVQPRIEMLKSSIYASAMPPALHAIATGDPATAWAQLDDLPQKRAIVEYLAIVLIKPAGRGRWTVPIEERIMITERAR